MKPIYLLSFLIVVLIINSVSAQKEYCFTNYTAASIPYNPVQPYTVGTKIVIPPNYYYYLSVPIGFNFNFYGHYYNSLSIAANGLLSFSAKWGTQINNSIWSSLSLPDDYFEKNVVCLFAEDLWLPQTSSSVRYSTIGLPPNRKFIVSYDSMTVKDYFSSDKLYYTGQIVLYETSNIIEMYIESAKASTDGVQGVQNSDASEGVLRYGYGGGQWWTDVLNDGVRYTQHNIPNINSIDICLVGVDSATNKNMVIWNKTPIFSVDSFIIYKETNVAGVFATVGSQKYGDFSTFIDTSSNPAQQSNRYRIGYVDSCGMTGGVSYAHKTVHLSISQGIGNTWNLNWDNYEGIYFTTFNLYRGTSKANMTLLTSIASNIYSYTDLTPPIGNVYYMIEVVNPSSCTPNARTTSANSSFSNIVTNNPLAIQSYIDPLSISVYPNPVKNLINISLKLNLKTDINIEMDGIVGHVVYSKLYKGVSDLFEQNIDCSNLSAGVYFLQLKTEGGNINRKIIVE